MSRQYSLPYRISVFLFLVSQFVIPIYQSGALEPIELNINFALPFTASEEAFQTIDPQTVANFSPSGALVASNAIPTAVNQTNLANEQITTPYPLQEPVYLADQTHIGRTLNFHETNPHWEDITPRHSDNTLITGINDFVLDPAQPEQKAWVAATSGIWYADNLDQYDEQPNWELLYSSSEMRSAYLQVMSDNPLQQQECGISGPVRILFEPLQSINTPVNRIVVLLVRRQD